MFQVVLQCGEESLALDGSGTGARIRAAGWQPVSESAGKLAAREELEVEIEGSAAQADQVWEDLGHMLERSDLPVYLVCQAAGGTAWRSRVRGGRLEPKSVGLRGKGGLCGKLLIERDNWWEGPETQAPLSNANGQNVTGELAVFNCADGAGDPPLCRQNWVEIAQDMVGGDLPAAARLEITNLGTDRLYDLWIGQNWTDPANCGQVYEAEQAAGESGLPDSACSGGMLVVKELPGGVETELLRWALDGETLSAGGGQRVHALVRFASAGWEVNTRFRLTMQWHMTDLWRSDLVQPRADRALQIRDLFQLRMPPGTGLAGLDLVLSGLQSSGEARELRFDFLALVPADGWRYLTCCGYGLEPGERVVDDGLAERLYGDDGAGEGQAEVLMGFGGRIQLRARRKQRLYFFSHTVFANQAPVGHHLGVKIFFRPRRRAL